MILLPILKDGGLVTIEVSIAGTPVWAYVYEEDQSHHNDASANRTKKHTIGQPYEILKSLHSWEFRLGNPSIAEIEVLIEISWLQDGIKIQEWKRKVEIKESSGEIITEEALIFKKT